jgi:hypothetical protein
VIIAMDILLYLAAGYLLAGALFAVLFHARGVHRVDPAAAGAGAWFRVLITPGVVALWPLLAFRWRRHTQGGVFAGETERPLSARGLRRMHGLLIQLLAVLAPLAVAAALLWRPD